MSLKPLRELPRLYAWRFNPSTFSIAARFSEGNLLWKDRRASSIVGRERSLIRQEQHIAQVTNMAPQKGSRYEKWPVAILAAAEKSGALSITSQRAVIILEKFQALGSKSAEEFCTDYQIKPIILSLLAKILLRTRDRDHHLIAQKLLFAASRLGDTAATFLLVKEAIRLQRLTNPNLTGPRRHLQTLVNKGNLKATYLAGQIHESEGKFSHALKIYGEAASSHGNASSGESSIDNSLGDIWKAISRLKANAGDHIGARAAMETCALEYDDPWAYYELAKLYTLPFSENYATYMLKAAVSGEPEAAYELGVYYHQQCRGDVLNSSDNVLTKPADALEKPSEQRVVERRSTTPVSPTKPEKGTQARDWLAIAAESDVLISQLYLAILLHGAGKFQEATEWLDRASTSKQWTPAISWIQSMWDREEIVDIDSTRDGKTGAGRITLAARGERILISE